MLKDTHYHYVEFAKGFKNRSTDRLPIEEVLEAVYRDSDPVDWCYTINQWAKVQPEDGELELLPLYFDLDSADLEIALKDCRKLVDWIVRGLGIDEEELVRVFFSGSKGFHVIVDPRSLDIQPDKDLVRIIKIAATKIKSMLDLVSLDLKVYSKRRLWRCPGAKHSKTGLWVTEMNHCDLMLPIEDIKEMAQERRDPLYSGWPMDVEAVASSYWDNVTAFADADRRQMKTRNATILPDVEGMPLCIKDLLSTGVRVAGQRNSAQLALVTFFAEKGIDINEAEEIITDWAINKSLSSEKPHSLRAAVKADLQWAYNNDTFFSCDHIRSLGRGTGRPIECAGEKCEHVKIDQDAEKPIELSIEEIDADYLGRRVKFMGQIFTYDDSPVVIPSVINMSCDGTAKKSMCRSCPHVDTCMDSKAVTVHDKEILSLASELREENGVRRVMNIPGLCKSWTYEVVDRTNIRSGEVRGVVDFSTARQDSGRINVHFANKVRVEVGQKYEITGVVQADPKTRKVCVVAEAALGVRDSFLEFNPTPQKIEALTIFQAEEDTVDSVESKIEEIELDITDNIHGIRGREKLVAAVDLAFHSVISFNLHGYRVPNGYIDLVIIGDTNVGKSSLAKRLKEFYCVGEVTTTENISSAGMLGAVTKNPLSGDWFVTAGLLPRNDMGLVVLDESHNEKARSVIEQMSDCRSEGVVKINKAGDCEMAARCRKIFVANPPKKMKCREFQYPIKMLEGIMPSPEDQRRVDLFLAIPVNRNASYKKMHRQAPPNKVPKYHSALCRDLINWVWSRRPSQVVISQEVDDLIKEFADKMHGEFHAIHPLVDLGNLGHKLAKGAVAVAARLFSCDRTGKKIIVKPCHVEYYYKFVMDLYMDDDIALDRYVRDHIGATELTTVRGIDGKERDEFEILRDTFLDLSGNGLNLARLLNDRESFTFTDIKNYWPGASDMYVDEEVKSIIGALEAHKCIVWRQNKFYRKSEKGLILLTRLLKDDKLYRKGNNIVDYVGDEKYEE